MEKIFFDSWSSIFRTITIGILSYTALIFLLRISGKRTLSKMNAFDFIVTVALGSTLATVLLNKNIALADGVLGFFLLIFLQYLITWLSVRSKKVRSWIKSDPSLIVYKGIFLHSAMVKERITEEEILAVLREQGKNSLNEIDAIVLETDGSLSVIQKTSENFEGVLRNVKRPANLK